MNNELILFFFGLLSDYHDESLTIQYIIMTEQLIRYVI